MITNQTPEAELDVNIEVIQQLAGLLSIMRPVNGQIPDEDRPLFLFYEQLLDVLDEAELEPILPSLDSLPTEASFLASLLNG